MKTVDGVAEPLSASVRPDLRPAGIGGCTCPAGTNYAACTCAWGVMITRMFQLGYGRDADAVTIAREAQDLSDAVEQTLGRARRTAVKRLAREWPGSVAALGRLVGLSGQRVAELVPDVSALVRAAKAREASRRSTRSA